MTVEKITLKAFIKDETLFEKKKKKKKKRRKGGLADSWFTDGGVGAGSGAGNGSSGASAGVGESFILELLAGITPSSFSANINSVTAYSKNSNDKDAGMTTYPSENRGAYPEEEPEMKINKVDQARQLFQAMYDRPGTARADIINAFMKDIGVKNSTAISYYTRFLSEFGLSSKDGDESLGQSKGMGKGMGDPARQYRGDDTANQIPDEEPPEMEDSVDPNRAGIIRIIKSAHLVYKKQNPQGGFNELWIYNLHNSTHDELNIRREILAGTDIPQKKTKSADGSQSYTVTTMGNAQLLLIKNLPN